MNNFTNKGKPTTESSLQQPVGTVRMICGDDDTTEISTDRQLQENYNLEEWTDGIRISWM